MFIGETISRPTYSVAQVDNILVSGRLGTIIKTKECLSKLSGGYRSRDCHFLSACARIVAPKGY